MFLSTFIWQEICMIQDNGTWNHSVLSFKAEKSIYEQNLLFIRSFKTPKQDGIDWLGIHRKMKLPFFFIMAWQGFVWYENEIICTKKIAINQAIFLYSAPNIKRQFQNLILLDFYSLLTYMISIVQGPKCTDDFNFENLLRSV